MVTTAKETHASETPAVIVVGPSELARAIGTIGFDVHRLEGPGRLLEAEPGIDGRAIVIDRSAIGDAIPLDDLVRDLRRAWPLVDLVVVSPDAGPDDVREALRAGARDVLLQREPARVAEGVRRIVDAQRLMARAAELGYETSRGASFHGMLARSRKMWDLFDMVSRIARVEAPVLILGETGTGKELIARAIHRLSERPGRFVPVNCAAIAEDLVDSELFGHVKGAFTGALRDKRGLFRHADDGTLMLDEIGRIAPATQHRLLRVLQEGRVRPVGGHVEKPVDVRIIAATSTDIESDVAAGRIREDLFFRLDVLRLEIPPLRERPEDVVFLFGHFARQLANQYELVRPDVTDEFLDELIGYAWPGNVRQLENFTERLLLTHAGGVVAAKDFRKHLGLESRGEPGEGRDGVGAERRSRAREDAADDLRASMGSGPSAEGSAPREVARPASAVPGLGMESPSAFDRPLPEVLERQTRTIERAYLDHWLKRTHGRVGEAAQHAGISRRTMLRKMQALGLDKHDYRSSGTSSASSSATGDGRD